MRLRLSPRSAAVFALPVALGGIVAVPTSAQAATYNGPLQITEVQYNGSEFIEFTNTSAAAVDMSGWSFSDSGRTPGAVSFSSVGTLPAGASFILAEDTESTFRAQWGLTACTGLKVIGGNTQNLGRSDEV